MSNYTKRIIRSQPTMTDFDLFSTAFLHNKTVLLEGPSGAGKTQAVISWAQENSLPITSINFGFGATTEELFGKWTPKVDGGFTWLDGPVTALMKNGDGVILLDEINLARPEVTAMLHSLLDFRREVNLMNHYGEKVVPTGKLLIVGTMNPSGQYTGTYELNQALRRRFDFQLNWDYNSAVEQELISSPQLLELIALLRNQSSENDGKFIRHCPQRYSWN